MSRTVRRRIWNGLDLVLVLIIVGPVLAPFFLASGLWPLPTVAQRIIYPLGRWICPQDHFMVGIGPGLMAVCTRCYAAIGGLLLVRTALSADPTGQGVAGRLARRWSTLRMPARALAIVSVVALWQVDIWAERLDWWSWGQGMMVATGPVVGLAIGFLAYGLLAAATGRPAAWDRPAAVGTRQAWVEAASDRPPPL